MCKTKEEIVQENIVIQELDDYINDNGDKKNTLIMRVLKHNLISSIQIQQDMSGLAEHIEECKESPSLSSQFKAHPLKTIGSLFMVFFCLFAICFTITTVVGLQEIIKSAIP